MSAYPKLLAPLRVRGQVLPNRIVMGSMHTGVETLPGGFARMAEFYAARARGGAALMVTGGFAPNAEGAFGPGGPLMVDQADAAPHLAITEAVHKAGGRILMQILHTGRYGKHEAIVAPSAIRAPINSFTPRAMSADDIRRTLAEYGRAAALAVSAGYDGVEIMGSEGYLINSFLVTRTNKRDDDWGGAYANRMRFAVEAVRAVRAQVPEDFIVMFRLSMIDLVDEGSTAAEIAELARALERAGTDILNSGIGWHEAKVPTIAAMVPPAAWSWATGRVKAAVAIPVMASNRIDSPETAEGILARGEADLVSMARPLLADPELAAKARRGERGRINLCIGCNQGCLDGIFSGGICSCLVNPKACRETELVARPAAQPKRIAVVGGGPAGLAFAVEAQARGHRVTLFEAQSELGGQFLLARAVPGKEGYLATPSYFAHELARLAVEVRLGRPATAQDLRGFDRVVLATGAVPRPLDLAGADHPMVASYEDILSGKRRAGQRVAIIGSGGIGFDVAAFLVAEGQVREDFYAAWGVDRAFAGAGGLLAKPAEPPTPRRRIVMLQRKTTRPGADLGKTTGWIHKAHLARMGVEMLAGASYRKIDDAGLHIVLKGEEKLIGADTVVVAAGQRPADELAMELGQMGIDASRIGGAREALGLDAMRAIFEGIELAQSV
ncbi:MAG: NADPH-dependent 2,4-dienoyl-CoA reductase [Rhodospirillales bacterium]|nr:NADPH-dependent 2,4-dienoyl-CoA reductase [Rhodospirillales bacterium]